MKRIFTFAILGITFLLSSAFVIYLSQNYVIKENAYGVTFKGDKMSGTFKGLKAKIDFDEAHLNTAKISASIDAATVDTDNWLKNRHARAGLGADDYPTIKFESTSIRKTSTGYEAVGNLTLKDVTKAITLPFTFTPDNTGGTFSGKFTITTKDFHVTKSGTPDVVEITLKVPVTKG